MFPRCLRIVSAIVRIIRFVGGNLRESSSIIRLISACSSVVSKFRPFARQSHRAGVPLCRAATRSWLTSDCRCTSRYDYIVPHSIASIARSNRASSEGAEVRYGGIVMVFLMKMYFSGALPGSVMKQVVERTLIRISKENQLSY